MLLIYVQVCFLHNCVHSQYYNLYNLSFAPNKNSLIQYCDILCTWSAANNMHYSIWLYCEPNNLSMVVMMLNTQKRIANKSKVTKFHVVWNRLYPEKNGSHGVGSMSIVVVRPMKLILFAKVFKIWQLPVSNELWM